MTSKKYSTKKEKKEITKIFALGGLGEVGKNTYCIEHKDEILIIDAGLKFPEKILLSVEAIIPDYDYLIKARGKIKNLFITHGHEDHIGGIPNLISKVKIENIYSPKLASDLIQNKIKRSKNAPKIIEYDEDTIIKTNNFEVTFFSVTHSIPNAFGIIVKGKNGVIVTTGDFKFDWTPLNKKTELHKIARIGENGVDLLLSDSTNSEVCGYTKTEKKIIQNINFLMQNSKQRILVTTFASNFNRIFSIISCAKKTNRKVLIVGTSILNIIKIVKKRKYFDIDSNVFIKSNELNKYKNEEIIIICTGSQGETNSVINKIANSRHPFLKVDENDLLIFSSNPIPGNNSSVQETINKLKKKNVKIYVNNQTNQLHTSGHACKEEQKIMLSLIKPKYFMPMHGEYRMLKIHGMTAKETGIKEENIFICRNGDQILLHKNKAWRGKSFVVNPVYLGKNKKNEETMMILNERQLMLKNGFFGIITIFDVYGKKLLETPKIILRGSFYMKTEQNFQQKIEKKIISITNEFLSKFSFDKKELKKQIKKNVEDFIYEEKKINPLINVSILKKIN